MIFRKIIFLSILFLFVCISTYYFFPYIPIATELQIDKIVVIKSKRQLHVYSQGKVIRTFTISLGKSPNGDKMFEGDFKTPEGVYYINAKNSKSGYHKNLGISYPDFKDIREANLVGRTPGGDIKIHGIKNGRNYLGRFHRWVDWTNGCIALTNEEIDDLYHHTPIGTIIIIRP